MPSARAGDGPGPECAPDLTHADRAELVLRHIGLADSLARRHAVRGHDLADLVQVARLGLLSAAARYDAGEGEFVSFAVPTILGEIRHYVRDYSWVVRPPRGIQELRLRVNSARVDLEQSLGREPSMAELAEELGLTLAEVAEGIVADAALVPHPLVGGDEDEAGPELGALDPGFREAELRVMIENLLRDVSTLERQLLHLRFVREMSQKEIAGELGVSQMQVSRLLRKLLQRLRERLDEEPRLDGEPWGVQPEEQGRS
ncbi:sigma-70 family RNA polymerase sigma factor [Sinomonas susongensis]|uniref:sigma-70 family RNA polymerase sigma factor n=1 Tax=Sinomonas susongensis TaxID=1324851 RepID=UPI001109E24F|nr:sigma-70 family RNA polymerase sigma factor [Sinomonas susongensis]